MRTGDLAATMDEIDPGGAVHSQYALYDAMEVPSPLAMALLLMRLPRSRAYDLTASVNMASAASPQVESMLRARAENSRAWWSGSRASVPPGGWLAALLFCMVLIPPTERLNTLIASNCWRDAGLGLRSHLIDHCPKPLSVEPADGLDGATAGHHCCREPDCGFRPLPDHVHIAQPWQGAG